ncbi:hypothetical protein NPX13_g10748 [Xylaria arbuscula]|uniref:Transmembrane protein n=1 Tax=Xylaria arbuscula TaxID=114810 RepID=A0A9W8N476_9PEZI|nr:hypothetical protein NPX13_g10748 [Xylaria arbuscula]
MTCNSRYPDGLDDAGSLREQSNPSLTTQQAPNDTELTWLPYTLRWPCFLATICFTCTVLAFVIAAHAISCQHSGLVPDDGSGVLKIGFRLVPTLFATIYVFLSSTILDDIKRTEPFARLASPDGAPADLSVTWSADPWWKALISSFPSRRKKANWAMLSATVAFVLGSLILSPLSSSLIVSQTVVLTQDTQFRQLSLEPSMPIQEKPQSETYYRSIRSLLRNVSTSAWILDQYAVVPFWPASVRAVPLGPVLFETDETWRATTTVFSTELICEPLILKYVSDATVWHDGVSQGSMRYFRQKKIAGS